MKPYLKRLRLALRRTKWQNTCLEMARLWGRSARDWSSLAHELNQSNKPERSIRCLVGAADARSEQSRWDERAA